LHDPRGKELRNRSESGPTPGILSKRTGHFGRFSEVSGNLGNMGGRPARFVAIVKPSGISVALCPTEIAGRA